MWSLAIEKANTFINQYYVIPLSLGARVSRAALFSQADPDEATALVPTRTFLWTLQLAYTVAAVFPPSPRGSQDCAVRRRTKSS